MGKLPSAKGCNSHKPNPYLFVGSEENVDRLGMIATAIRGMPSTVLQGLAALIQAEKTTRKYGWHFYQKVYVRYTGTSNENYFSNFTVGHVVYADKDYVRIIGRSGKLLLTLINDKLGHTVYTVEEFKKISREMARHRRFSAPEAPKVTHAFIKPLDEVLASDEPLNAKLIRSKAKMDDLVSIISKLSQGYGLKPPKTTRKSTKKSSELVVDWNK